MLTFLRALYFPAGRDELASKDPYEFRSERRPNRHLRFGCWPHTCVGQHLARLETQIFRKELLLRLDSNSTADERRRQHSEFACGPKSAPTIRYAMIGLHLTQNQGDPDSYVVVEQWDSRAHYARVFQ